MVSLHRPGWPDIPEHHSTFDCIRALRADLAAANARAEKADDEVLYWGKRAKEAERVLCVVRDYLHGEMADRKKLEKIRAALSSSTCQHAADANADLEWFIGRVRRDSDPQWCAEIEAELLSLKKGK